MKNRGMASTIIVAALLMLLPLVAHADQCTEGDCVNGKGTMVYSTGHKYTGEFKNGLRDGEGLHDHARRPDAERPVSIQTRSSKGPTPTRMEKFTPASGSFASATAGGTLKYADGRVYDGEFKSGLRHGKGVMTWPSGRRYEGDFVKGNRTGKGTLTYPDGRVYTGDFVDGEQTGRGVMTLPGGKRLEGRFTKGEIRRAVTPGEAPCI